MIIVTGGAGFIGSNLVKALNQRGRADVVVVDDLTDGTKFANIADCDLADYLDMADFLAQIKTGYLPQAIEAIFHLGACSATTEWNGRYMMENNYEYSKQLFHYAVEHEIPLIYASSAAVYGAGAVFEEDSACEQPLNVYGYSKYLFDQYVRQHLPRVKSQVAGVRYFNVYGPRESHKGSMSSVAYHLNNQVLESGTVKLFEGSDGYGNGEQLRDFIFVEDAVKVKLWLLDNPGVNGIFNVGTGRAQPFNDVARAVLDWHGRGELQYIPFPDHLKGRYQSYTQANISRLRGAGYDQPFKSVAEGVREYLDWLNGRQSPQA